MKSKGNFKKSRPLTWKGKAIDNICISYKDGDKDKSHSILEHNGKKIRIAESKVRKLIEHWENSD